MRTISIALGLLMAVSLTGCGQEGQDYEPQAQGTFEQDVREGGPEEATDPRPTAAEQALPEYEETTPAELSDGDE